jgi:hypothetical protein
MKKGNKNIIWCFMVIGKIKENIGESEASKHHHTASYVDD